MFDTLSIIAYVVGLVLLYILCKIFIRPIRWLFKIVLNGIIGGLILAQPHPWS